jgi:hypothetical protein
MGTAEQNDRMSATLLNLYELLGLEPLEGDRTKVEAALRNTMAQAKATCEKDPKRSQRLAKIAELGKRNLLSARAKVAYDARWQAAFGNRVPATVSLASSDWNYTSLTPLLPEGSPDEPFDLGGFLEIAATQPEVQIEADYLKLHRLLTGAETPAAPTPIASIAPTVHTTADMVETSASRTGTQSNAVSPRVSARSTQPPKSKNLAKQLRKKRDQSLLFMIGGVLLSLGVLLALIFLVFLRDEPEDDSAKAGLALNQGLQMMNQGVAPDAQAVPVAPRGSGLPKVSGLDAIDGASTPDMAQLPSSSMPESPITETPSIAPMTEPPAPLTEPMMPIPDPSVSVTAMVEPTTVSIEPAPVVMPEPDLTDRDKDTWSKAMHAVREAIGRQDFALATENLSKAELLSRSAIQKGQFGRLKEMKVNAEDFHQALVKAIAGLGPAAVINVKSTQVSFVEGSAEKIIIKRDGGRNETYALTEIPVGLAFALVDLELDMAHASTLARKAAFALFHPKTNGLALEQAQKMLEEAMAAGFVRKDMAEVFTDDYRL